MQWMEFLQCRMVLYTLRVVEFACLDKSVKKDETLLFPEKNVNKNSPLTWAGFCVCLHRKATSPTSLRDDEKIFQSHPKKGIFCISANQNKVCSVFLWPVMEIFSSKWSIPFNSNRSLSWQTEGWVAITVVVRFKCKGQIVKIKIVNRSIFLSLTVLCHST